MLVHLGVLAMASIRLNELPLTFNLFLTAICVALVTLIGGTALLCIGAVVATEASHVMSADLPDSINNRIQEGAIVAGNDECAVACAQRTLQPLDRLNVEMVRRLVEQQQVWIGDHQPRQGDAGLLPSGEACRGLAVPCRWEAEPSQRRTHPVLQGVPISRIKLRPRIGVLRGARATIKLHLAECGRQRDDLGGTADHGLNERRGIQQIGVLRRLLREEVDAQPLGMLHAPLVGRLKPRDHLEEGRLPCPVRSDQADALASGNADRHLIENDRGADFTTDIAQRDDAHAASPWRAERRRAAARSLRVAPTVSGVTRSLQRGPRTARDATVRPAPRGGRWQVRQTWVPRPPTTER